MPTPTRSNRLPKQAKLENVNTWGDQWLGAAFDGIDFSADGQVELDVNAGPHALTVANYTPDEARGRCVILTGVSASGAYALTVPDVPKWYWLCADSRVSVTVQVAGKGSAVIRLSVDEAAAFQVRDDGSVRSLALGVPSVGISVPVGEVALANYAPGFVGFSSPGSFGFITLPPADSPAWIPGSAFELYVRAGNGHVSIVGPDGVTFNGRPMADQSGSAGSEFLFVTGYYRFQQSSRGVWFIVVSTGQFNRSEYIVP